MTLILSTLILITMDIVDADTVDSDTVDTFVVDTASAEEQFHLQEPMSFQFPVDQTYMAQDMHGIIYHPHGAFNGDFNGAFHGNLNVDPRGNFHGHFHAGSHVNPPVGLPAGPHGVRILPSVFDVELQNMLSDQYYQV